MCAGVGSKQPCLNIIIKPVCIQNAGYLLLGERAQTHLESAAFTDQVSGTLKDPLGEVVLLWSSQIQIQML